MHVFYSLPVVSSIVDGAVAILSGAASHGASIVASVLLQVGPEQAVCNMLNAIKGWTGILVFAAAIAIGFALILRGLAPEFSTSSRGR